MQAGAIDNAITVRGHWAMIHSDRSLASAAVTIPSQNISLKSVTQPELSDLVEQCSRRFYGVISPYFEGSHSEKTMAGASIFEGDQTFTDLSQTDLNARRLLTSLLMPILWLKCCEEQGSLTSGTLYTLGQQTEAYRHLWQLLQDLPIPQCINHLIVANDLPPAALNQAVQALVESICDSNLTRLSHSIIPDRCKTRINLTETVFSKTLLLGHVYESLLGASASANTPCKSQSSLSPKSQGQYYTPISIVEGMLDRTLGHWLTSPSKELDYSLFNDDGSSNAPPSELAPMGGSKGAEPQPSIRQFTLLDPACGAGIFLVMAYQQILTSVAQGPQLLTFETKKQLLLDHIYGVDLDPQAVYVTQLSLWLMLLAGERLDGERIDKVTLPDLSRNIQWGNALVGPDIEQQVKLPPEQRDRLHPFDWSTAFPQIFSGDSEQDHHGFDIVIGNPPYVDAEWMTVHQPEVRRYCSRHYASASGNWDLFCVFCEKAVQLCRTGGLSSLIVPNKLAAADYAQKTRHLLAMDNRLLSLRDYSAVSVFSIAVYPLVYVVQKLANKKRPKLQDKTSSTVSLSLVSTSPLPLSSTAATPLTPTAASPKIQWERVVALATGDRPPVLEQRSLSYSEVCHDQRPWAIATTPLLQTLVTRLHQTGIPLGQLAPVVGAATVSEAYDLKPLLLENTLLEKLLSNRSGAEQPRADSQSFKFINSGTIDPYRFLWGQKPVRYLKTKYAAPVVPFHHQQQIPPKRWLQAESPKIIVAGMTLVLECALDSTGEIFPGKSTTVIRSSHELRYLLAILNSRLMGVYYRTEFGGNALNGGYLRIGPPQIKQLPIVMGTEYQQQRLVKLVDALHAEYLTEDSSTAKAAKAESKHDKSRPAKKDRPQSVKHPRAAHLCHQIDQQVYELYGLSTEEICLIERYELP